MEIWMLLLSNINIHVHHIAKQLNSRQTDKWW